MNIEQEQRLEKIFKENDNKGIAIAITGCWGIGKTFFWNRFFEKQTIKEFDKRKSFYYEASKFEYRDVFENKKYAYVSLFGIETLDGLKNEIALKVGWNPHSQNVHHHYGIPQLLKTTLNQFKDIKFSHYGVSSSSRLIDSLLFSQVRNAIICFDDFERLSEKLNIQDVMGLANQLKLERYCQVILILHESKNEDKNKKKYAEYKEKLIDETIKIISVEPLIRAKTQDIDKPLVDLMVKFADELEIHNFRFFQKVINLYQQFRGQLPNEVAYPTKEIILIRILQGYFIEDFGQKDELGWNEFLKNEKRLPKALRANKNEVLEKKENVKLSSFRKISLSFYTDDLWVIEFKKWFEQSGEPDFYKLRELANSDLISESNQKLKSKIWGIFERRFNLQVVEDDFKHLSTIGKEMISIETIYNTSVAYEFIKKYLEDQNYSNNFKSNVIEFIDQNIEKMISRKQQEIQTWNYDDNVFYEYIDRLVENHREEKKLSEILSHFLQYDYFKNDSDRNNLREFKSDDWFKYLTKDIYSEKFYLQKEKTIVACLRQLVKIHVDGYSLRQTIVDVLYRIGQESAFKQRFIQDIIENHLDEDNPPI